CCTGSSTTSQSTTSISSTRAGRGDRRAGGQGRNDDAGGDTQPSERASARPSAHPAHAHADPRCRAPCRGQRRRGRVQQCIRQAHARVRRARAVARPDRERPGLPAGEGGQRPERGDEKLTVIASLLLLPTFIVGLYGQNFQHNFPELHWRFGYGYSWGLIIVTTVLQLWYFHRKKWI